MDFTQRLRYAVLADKLAAFGALPLAILGFFCVPVSTGRVGGALLIGGGLGFAALWIASKVLARHGDGATGQSKSTPESRKPNKPALR